MVAVGSELLVTPLSLFLERKLPAHYKNYKLCVPLNSGVLILGMYCPQIQSPKEKGGGGIERGLLGSLAMLFQIAPNPKFHMCPTLPGVFGV